MAGEKSNLLQSKNLLEQMSSKSGTTATSFDDEMNYMAWRKETGIGARGHQIHHLRGLVPRPTKEGISLNQENHSSQAVRCTITSYVTTGERLTPAEIRKRQMKKLTRMGIKRFCSNEGNFFNHSE
jgi:hypothetical protein